MRAHVIPRDSITKKNLDEQLSFQQSSFKQESKLNLASLRISQLTNLALFQLI